MFLLHTEVTFIASDKINHVGGVVMNNRVVNISLKLAKVTIIHHIENHIHLEERVLVVGRKKMTVLLLLI